MANPLFWLALSLLLVAISLLTVLWVLVPTLQELGRAARSAEKLCDTLNREIPPTLEALRLTGLEITELADDLTEGVQSASQVVQQVDQSLYSARRQVKQMQTGSLSLWAGMRAAWQVWQQPPDRPKSRRKSPRNRPYRFTKEPAHTPTRPSAKTAPMGPPNKNRAASVPHPPGQPHPAISPHAQTQPARSDRPHPGHTPAPEPPSAQGSPIDDPSPNREPPSSPRSPSTQSVD